ncbi:hypothetical protein DL93DRAFT_1096072 [Clavulina sp. PMI_390]|nr:hypothetical protein DL93DRAFT_1096072 [Clavulina sp. PMI_390]
MSALNSSDLPSYGLDDSLVDDDADDPPRYVGRRVPRSLTSHTYETRHQSSATITLLLNTSRSPSASNLPLFYLPATVGGEVQLLLSKKMSIKRIVVTVCVKATFLALVMTNYSSMSTGRWKYSGETHH